MPAQPIEILNDPGVRTALWQAWQDSKPEESEAHEEGGFVQQESVGRLAVSRWPTGTTNRIQVPPHDQCKYAQIDIVATFHTHPNIGGDYLQEPSETDRRGVRDDVNLKGDGYLGEFVIARQVIYLVSPTGEIAEVGTTDELLIR